ncbi:hypothetical protein [Emticicia sp. BO119]|uniref:hypothetical protein n=1 Tax=Emticicia sp. BO119 TaxID=2757768 RepID=UPI0015F05F9E|nr:hypothetical protein [Emticicia sp. BO119]MBA4852703.1 hypothetical protein [Emticicia sp. BO119]
MKIIYTLIILCFLSLSAFCQSIDQNGRTPEQQKITSVAPVQEPYLQEDTSAKTVASFKLKYALPTGKTSGEIILFHPKADQILKKISLTQQQGSVEVSTKDLPIIGVIAALFTDTIPIQTKAIKLVE